MAVIDSRIEQVKLYHRGATVQRVATIEAASGGLPSEITFRGLPLTLDDQSIRISVEPNEDGSVPEVSIRHYRVGLSAYTEEEEAAPPSQEAIQALIQEIAHQELRCRQWRGELALLDAVELPQRPTGEEGKPPPASPMAARIALEQFVFDAQEERLEELQQMEQKLVSLREELAAQQALARQISDAQTIKKDALYKTVTATLHLEEGAPTRVRVALSYFVNGARWSPTYQCKLSRDGSAASVQMRALVSQRTGEDWKGVKLQLSTAAPMQWTELPELRAIRIGRAQAPAAPKRKGFRPPPRGAQQLFRDYDDAMQAASRMLPSRAQWSPPTLVVEPVELPVDTIIDSLRTESAPQDDMTFMYTSQVDLSAAELSQELDRYADKARVIGGLSAGGGGGAPPPPPAPKPAMAPSIMASSLAFGGATEEEVLEEEELDLDFDGYGAIEKEVARKSSFRKYKKKAGKGSASRKTSQMSEAQVRFTELQLHGPDDASARGKLMPLRKEQVYTRSLLRLHKRVTFDVLEVVMSAHEEAVSHDHAAPPEGTHDVRQSAGHFDYSYETDATVDVPSDGRAHSISVGSREASADMRYVVVPRENPHVYRVALLENPMHAPLLPGPAELYVGDEFILSTQLPLVPPKGEFRLWLGVEQAIKCARNTRFREERSGTKVVAMTELHHEIDIELSNRLAREIKCEVRERIPQPDTEAEVVVEEKSIKPAWELYEQLERHAPIEGGRRWQVSIPAGQTATLNASYVVKIYANNELVGGNRREA